MFSGKAVSAATQSKVSAFLQQLNSPGGTDSLKGLGLSGAQIKAVAGRAQFFAETGRFPEMESPPSPSQANAFPSEASPPAVLFKSVGLSGPSSFQPVSFMQPASAGAVTFGRKLSLLGTTLFLPPATSVSLAREGAIRLKSGEVCINANKHCTIILDQATISVAPSAVVLASKDKNGATVSVFHDRGAGDVVVRYGNMETLLSTGQELSIYREAGEPAQAEGHRRIVNHSLPGGVIATKSEVSLTCLMMHKPPLLLLKQSNDRHAHSLLNKITKTAACLQVATGAHGPYAGTAGK